MRFFNHRLTFAALVVAALTMLCSPALAGSASPGNNVAGLGDFDGDGQTDVLVQNASGLLYVYITDTDGVSVDNGNSGSPTSVPAGFSVVSVADFNADGRADVLAQEDATGLLYVYITAAGGITFEPESTNTASNYLVTIPAGYAYVGTGDTNADDRADILVQDSATGLVYVYITSSSAVEVDHASSGDPIVLPSGFDIVAVADFDGDGPADIMVQEASTGLLYTFISNDDGISIEGGGVPATVDLAFSFVGIGDYTADMAGARADIMVQNASKLLYIYTVDTDGVSVDGGGAPVEVPGNFVVSGI
ncbi:MAG: VCBS repeat-containing protein, partial [Polyangiaceae bacterium]